MGDRSAQIAAGRERLNKFRKATKREGVASGDSVTSVNASTVSLNGSNGTLATPGPYANSPPRSLPQSPPLAAPRHTSPVSSVVRRASPSSLTSPPSPLPPVSTPKNSISHASLTSAANQQSFRKEEVAKLVQDRNTWLAEMEKLDSQLKQALNENTSLHNELRARGDHVRSSFEHDLSGLRDALLDRSRRVEELERSREEERARALDLERRNQNMESELAKQVRRVEELEERTRGTEVAAAAATAARAAALAARAEPPSSPNSSHHPNASTINFTATSPDLSTIAQLANLQYDLDRKTELLDSALFDVRRLTDALTDQEVLVTSLRSMLEESNAVRTTLATDVERLAAQLKDSESRLAAAQSVVSEATSRAHDLEAELAERTQRAASLETEIVRLALERDRENVERARLVDAARNGQVQALQTENLALVKGLEEARARVSEVEKESDSLRTEEERLRGKITRLEQETQAFGLMNEELTRLRDLIRGMDSSRSSLVAAVTGPGTPSVPDQPPEPWRRNSYPAISQTLAITNREPSLGSLPPQFAPSPSPPHQVSEEDSGSPSPPLVSASGIEADVAEPASLTVPPAQSSLLALPTESSPTAADNGHRLSVSITHRDLLDEIARLRDEVTMLEKEVRTVRHVKDQLQEKLVRLDREKRELEAKLEKEQHVNELLARENDNIPAYVVLYQQERRTLLSQVNRLLARIRTESGQPPPSIGSGPPASLPSSPAGVKAGGSFMGGIDVGRELHVARQQRVTHVGPCSLNAPEGKSKFEFNDRLFYWYPGHMVKSLRLMRNRLKSVDLVVEVRDARIPFSSVNPRFEFLIEPTSVERLVVYNKADLADKNSQKAVSDAFLRYRNQKVLFTSIGDKKAVRQILQRAALIAQQPQNEDKGISALIVGMPNVGKSSLINALREIGVQRGKAAKVGPEAGVTRQIQERIRIFENPPIYLVDTPGIMDPYISDPQQALKVALTGGTKDRLVVEEHVADYLLFILNQRGRVQPPQTSHELLPLVALRIGAVQQGGFPDLTRALNFWIRSYREGKWGRFTLDDVDAYAIEAFFANPNERHRDAEKRSLDQLKKQRNFGKKT
ncbi:Mitochondrial GTPase [Gonapodya sp. JEL0774]|nr:Mitochondrial GTPase [Gonapodya sp. JEL0774]